ncbi:MAG: HlyD family efflux transporter periplasmic adaptor subunit [Gammaproteobacteria bacterium]|nr:HlyD family efflux transporter periplasmic adaptor subunit [Gammaproteobacteria bacterium]
MTSVTFNTDDHFIRLLGLIALVISILIFCVWGGLAPMVSAVIAPGQISVADGSTQVEHLEGGIVKSLNVKEGNIVLQGDVLMTLDSTAISAKLESTLGRYIATLSESIRLQAEQSHLPQEDFPNYAQEVVSHKGINTDDVRVVSAIQAQNELFITRRKSIEGELNLLRERFAQLSEVKAVLPTYREQLTALQDMFSRSTIRAPSAGKVLGFSGITQESVIQAGETILQIVPQNSSVIVKARISPIDIDRVFIGQTAKIQLSALKAALTPEVEGEVIELSADRLTDKMTGQPYFEARIRLDEQTHNQIQLMLGMPADAIIRTGESTLLAYLTQPITDAFRRSFTEK